MTPGPASRPPHVDIAVDEGLTVRMRLAVADDAATLRAGFDHLSAESRYSRFFTAVPRLTGSIFDQLTGIDGVRHVAVAAFDPSRPAAVAGAPGDGFGIGVARWIQPRPGGPAELAVAVIDEYQGRGVGRLLVDATVVVARRHGIDRLDGIALASNRAMAAVLEGIGATELHPEPRDATVRTFAVVVDDAAAVALARHPELAALVDPP